MNDSETKADEWIDATKSLSGNHIESICIASASFIQFKTFFLTDNNMT